MKLTDQQKRWLKIILIILAVILVVENSGDTITVINRTPHEICAVYFSHNPDDGWGRDWLLTSIKSKHSRDFRLPIYWEWNADGAGYAGRLVSCQGEVIDTRMDVGADTNYYLWEIR